MPASRGQWQGLLRAKVGEMGGANHREPGAAGSSSRASGATAAVSAGEESSESRLL